MRKTYLLCDPQQQSLLPAALTEEGGVGRPTIPGLWSSSQSNLI